MRSLETVFSSLEDSPKIDPKSANNTKTNKAAKRLAAHRWSRRQRQVGIGLALVFVISVFTGLIWANRTGRMDFWILKTQYRFEAGLADLGLYARDIDVIGHKFTTHEDIRRALGAYDREPLTRLSPQQMVQRLETLPWVDRAMVQRQWPQSLNIWLEETQPLAILHRDQEAYVVDDSGKIIATADEDLMSKYPNLSGQGAEHFAPALLNALSAYPELLGRFVGATRHSSRRWNLYLQPGIEVRLPANDIEQALENLHTLTENTGILDKDIVALDLRGRRPLILR